MAAFPEVLPHGEIEAVFPGVFFVTGTSTMAFKEVPHRFSRNMTIVREGGDALTIVNSVRLDEAGLAALDALGNVRNVVRLGAFHGMDDPFYVDRYGATLWALPGMEYESGLKVARELRVGGEMPFADCSLFAFETSKQPEGILLLEREGGILVSCDSLQNWVAPDRFFDEPTAEKMREWGFFKPANIGPGWRRYCEPRAEDFARIEAMSFRHLLSAHGEPLRDEAHEKLCATFAEQFGGE